MTRFSYDHVFYFFPQFRNFLPQIHNRELAALILAFQFFVFFSEIGVGHLGFCCLLEQRVLLLDHGLELLLQALVLLVVENDDVDLLLVVRHDLHVQLEDFAIGFFFLFVLRGHVVDLVLELLLVPLVSVYLFLHREFGVFEVLAYVAEVLLRLRNCLAVEVRHFVSLQICKVERRNVLKIGGLCTINGAFLRFGKLNTQFLTAFLTNILFLIEIGFQIF